MNSRGEEVAVAVAIHLDEPRGAVGGPCRGGLRHPIHRADHAESQRHGDRRDDPVVAVGDLGGRDPAISVEVGRRQPLLDCEQLPQAQPAVAVGVDGPEQRLAPIGNAEFRLIQGQFLQHVEQRSTPPP